MKLLFIPVLFLLYDCQPKGKPDGGKCEYQKIPFRIEVIDVQKNRSTQILNYDTTFWLVKGKIYGDDFPKVKDSYCLESDTVTCYVPDKLYQKNKLKLGDSFKGIYERNTRGNCYPCSVSYELN